MTDMESALEIIARENYLSKDQMIEIMREALLNTWKEVYGQKHNVEVLFDKDKKDWKILRHLKGVEIVEDEFKEIAGEDKTDIHYFSSFPRGAIDFFRRDLRLQVEKYKHKEEFNAFQEAVGNIIQCKVKSIARDIRVTISDKYRAYIPSSNRVRTEVVKPGETIWALIDKVEEKSGYQITLDRRSIEFVGKLMEHFIKEIQYGVIKIRHIVRLPGYVSKVVVESNSSSENDPVAACVGFKGQKIKEVIDALKGESVDVVGWNDDPKEFISKCLKKVKISKIEWNNNNAIIVVPDDQIGLAIRQNISKYNVRFIDSILGINVTFVTDSEYSGEKDIELVSLAQKLNIGNKEEFVMAMKKSEGQIWKVNFSEINDIDLKQKMMQYMATLVEERENKWNEIGGDKDLFNIIKIFDDVTYNKFLDNKILTKESVQAFQSSYDFSSKTKIDLQLCILVLNSI